MLPSTCILSVSLFFPLGLLEKVPSPTTQVSFTKAIFPRSSQEVFVLYPHQPGWSPSLCPDYRGGWGKGLMVSGSAIMLAGLGSVGSEEEERGL